MLGQEQSKLNWIYVAIAAISSLFGIPTAYIFGISMLFGDGIRVMLDSEFYSRELFNFVLFLVGVSALGRFVFALVRTMWIDLSRNFPLLAKTMLGKALRTFLYSLFAVIVLFTVLSSMKIFLDMRLILSLALWCYLMLTLGYLSYSWGFMRQGVSDNFFKDYLKRSCGVRFYAADVYLLSVNIWIVVTFAVGLGYHRGISLSLSQPICIWMDDEVLEASIVGQTETGIIVAQVTSRQWTRITLPMGVAWINPEVFSYISNNQIKRINSLCIKRISL